MSEYLKWHKSTVGHTHMQDQAKNEISQLREQLAKASEQRDKLLELIYSAAVGEVAMGVMSSCEDLAEIAYSITDINAEQLRKEQE